MEIADSFFSGNLDSKSWILEGTVFRIPQAKISWFPESGLPHMGRYIGGSHRANHDEKKKKNKRKTLIFLFLFIAVGSILFSFPDSPHNMSKKTSKSSEKQEKQSSETSCLLSRLSPYCHKALTALLEYCDVYSLALGVLVILIIGSQWSQVGIFLSNVYLPHLCLGVCFFACAIRVKSEELFAAIKSYSAIFWGVLTILVVIPATGTQITKTIQFATMTNEDMNTSHSLVVGNVTAIGPTEFAIALQVFFIVPASMSAGAILVSGTGVSDALVTQRPSPSPCYCRYC